MIAHPRPLIEVFAAIPDFRKPRGKRHPLTAIFALAVVYLSPADKYHRLTRRLSQGQKGVEERALMAFGQNIRTCLDPSNDARG
jgi:hypothetical protein